MPIYQYEGQNFDLPEGLTKEQAIAKIESYLGKSSQVAKPSSPSGIAQGFMDPIYAAGQLVGKALEQVPENVTFLGRPVAASARAFTEKVVPQREQQYQAQREAAGETGMDLSRIAGNVVNPANLVAGVRAAPVVAGAIQGVLTPVTETGDFAQTKVEQAAGGAIGGKLGEVAAKAAGTALNPLVSKAEQTMRDLGVTPTAGQALGGAYRKAEDFAQNLPLIGEAVRNAREKVLFDFNKSVINKALNKVGDQLPANVIGRDAVAYAAEQVSNKYDDVLSKMQFNLDFKTTSDILAALNKASLPSELQKQEAINVLNKVALSRFDKPTLTGAEFKAIESDLRKEAQSYLSSPTKAEKDIGAALQDVLQVFKRELAAQNPKMTPQLRRVDSAYGDLAVMERAAANGGAVNGVFTPKNYQTAVRQADVTRNKKAYARGVARGQEVAEAAMEVMGKDAASTLEGRLALSGLGGSATALAASPLIAATYTDTGRKAVDALLRSRPELVRQFGGQVQQAAPTIGGLFGSPTLIELNR